MNEFEIVIQPMLRFIYKLKPTERNTLVILTNCICLSQCIQSSGWISIQPIDISTTVKAITLRISSKTSFGIVFTTTTFNFVEHSVCSHHSHAFQQFIILGLISVSFNANYLRFFVVVITNLYGITKLCAPITLRKDIINEVYSKWTTNSGHFVTFRLRKTFVFAIKIDQYNIITHQKSANGTA